jgi:RimJ/RimL family protein N-acetyltransferase
VIEAVTDKKWKKSVGNYVKSRANIYQELNDNYSFIGFVEDNKILGGLLFSDYDKYNIWVHLALESPRVCQRRFIKMLFTYCFITAKCGRITAMCKNGYKRNERLLKGVGFIKEGIIRKVMKINNEFVDGAIYGMLKEDCKWV